MRRGARLSALGLLGSAALLLGLGAPAQAVTPPATSGSIAPSTAGLPTAPLPVTTDPPYDARTSRGGSVPPPGANVPCTPSAQHPEPVVLVHGTFENQFDNWLAASPLLKNAGYCVFTLDYGGRPGSPFQGTEDIPTSAQQLADVVDEVLAQTGAAKVDLVGHSQGGMMPRWYIKFLGGEEKVDQLIGLSPSNHGTTANGFFVLSRLIPGARVALAGCVACQQQERGSDFLTQLNADGDIGSGEQVDYTVLQTRYDEVVTPYTSAFLAGATNITLQDVCAVDFTEHLGISYDPVALRLVLNALDPATAKAPRCTLVRPYTP